MSPLWLLSLAVFQLITCFQGLELKTPPENISEISYEESLEEIRNPGMGFYTPVCIHYLETGNRANENTAALQHLRLDLSQFSGKYNKRSDMELTQDMLDALAVTLENLEKNHCTAILRFAYDPWFSGKACEPSMEMILRHQEQLGEVIREHQEAVVSVECGLFGRWGEMHGSDLCEQQNFNQSIDRWLDVLPDSVPISVRTPRQYCGWLGIDLKDIGQNMTLPGERAYRVGIYDDGYLGSDTDLGTFGDREKEVEWLSYQAGHTLFGGEFGDVSTKGKVQLTAEYMGREGFLTHTSYLNGGWHEKVMEIMKKESYSGEDDVYRGQSGYTFIVNHLGYRFVVRAVSLTKEVAAGDTFLLGMDVENVGFANLVKPKNAVLILENEEFTVRYPLEGVSGAAESVNGDPTAWESRSVTEVGISCLLPWDMPSGEYKIYLRVAAFGAEEEYGDEGYPVRFANAGGNVWSDRLGANFLGTFIVTE